MIQLALLPALHLSSSALAKSFGTPRDSSGLAKRVEAKQDEAKNEWTLVEEVSGATFFDHWDFFTDSDPTNGVVDYVSRSEAEALGLISHNWLTGTVRMRADTTKVITGGRKSVRLEAKRNFTGGLILMDSEHIPYGCGTWPAWWSYGPDNNWPNSGEIDILEGIHDQKYNKVSVHSYKGCTMPKDLDAHQIGFLDNKTANPLNQYDPYNCNALEGDNKGCGVEDLKRENSYGKGFNDNRGGVYALLWTTKTIQIFFFPRGEIPEDIKCDKPDPSSWGTPVGNFTSPTCDPMTYFVNHKAIWTSTFCGAWANGPNVWNTTTDNGGQETPCSISTGYESCNDFVRHEGQAFAEASWDVNYVKYFNSTSL